MRRHPEGKSGAAMIESSVVLVILFLILFAVLQGSYMLAARDVLSFSSMATARSAQVGYNDFMLEKTARITSIPTAGPMITPNIRTFRGPSGRTSGELWDDAVDLRGGVSSGQYSIERRRIPAYLAAEHPGQLRAILDYDNWQMGDTQVRITPVEGTQSRDELLRVGVGQNVPMMMPYAKAIADLIPSSVSVRVYRTSTSDGQNHSFTVPAIDMADTIEVENHALYYLGDSE
ncbi:MAG: pilus assembly protein [Pontiellaceae bacterium]|nr:pilus assembly protein [Pontiellaceae bacterium]